jgi:hypothetical protein
MDQSKWPIAKKKKKKKIKIKKKTSEAAPQMNRRRSGIPNPQHSGK